MEFPKTQIGQPSLESSRGRMNFAYFGQGSSTANPDLAGLCRRGVRLSAATPKRRNDFLLIVVLVLSSVAVVGVIVFLQNSRASGNGASGESGGGLLASVGPDTNPQDGNQPVARSGQQSRADASRSGNAESGDPSQATESGEEEGGGPPLSAGEALSEMSLEEKVGQLLFLGMTPGTVLDPQAAGTLARLTPGGVVLFHRNIDDPERTKAYVSAMQSVSGSSGARVPLLVAADQEGGLIVRLGHGFTQFPGAMALGATAATNITKRVSSAAATEMRSVGFNMNLAPVLDVNTEPRNSAIGTRAFSDAPQLVADHGLAWIAGHKQAHVASVAKHFPGIGAAIGNTDSGPVVVGRDFATMREVDLFPFQAAVDAGVEAIMIALAGYPGLETAVSAGPAALSDRIATQLLRDEMKFQGVLITDALTSISVVGGRTVPETAVEAFSAGVDMIMVVMDGDVEWQTHAALVSYIEGQGLAGIERLNASVARILNLKTNLGLFGTDEPADAPFESNDDIESVAKSAGRAGVTFFSPDVRSWMPIADESVYLLEFDADPAYGFRDELGLDLSLASHLKALIPDLTVTTLSHAPSPGEVELTLGMARGAQVVIVALRDGWLHPVQIQAARQLAAAAPRTIIVALWSPYDLSSLIDTGALLLATYGDNPLQLDALGEQLLSPDLPQGIAPVRMP